MRERRNIRLQLHSERQVAVSRPKKKIVLFLVEGNTDINVLASPMQSLFDKYSSPDNSFIVEFCTYRENNNSGGDVTSSNGVTPDNIEGVISKNFIEPFMARNPQYYVKDICEVIQIVDLDGAFIPEEKIEKRNDDKDISVEYSLSSITAKDPSSILDRNIRKSANLQRLVGMSEIGISKNGGKNTKTVKYSVYYFSCNMDHCIHNVLNATTQEKITLSDSFMCKYDEIDSFYDYLIGQSICKNSDYQQSWEYVMKEGTSSLERCTNLNILIDKVKNLSAC